MRRLPSLVEIAPEGKIVAALVESPKNYSGLKSATGLSDRWLSKKLEALSLSGIVERKGSDYELKNPMEIINGDPLFAKYLQEKTSLKAKARLIAEEISHNELVVAVILFGSVAKERATEESDIDLLVVTEAEMEDQLNNTIYNLMFKHAVPVETIFLTYDDLIINLQAKTTFSFGLLEGYQTLYDRDGVENMLSLKKKEFQQNWIYHEEAQTWIQKKLLYRHIGSRQIGWLGQKVQKV